jgi:CopG family transcriptional regulator/antitoxin EndoAI
MHTEGVYEGENIMYRGTSTMHRRINVTLPEETVKLIDRVSAKGDRSRLIDHAVKQYITEIGQANPRKQLKEGALRRAPRDCALAEEWFLLDSGVKHAPKSKLRSRF